MRIQAMATFSSKGKRPAQEDYVLGHEEKALFAVADGFGGPTAGAAASKAACEAVKTFLVKEAGDLEATLPFELRRYFSLAGNVLFNALIHANRKVLKLNKDKSPQEKGGSSIIAGFMDGDLLALANVGACSAWLLRDHEFIELVTPRTYGRLCDPFSKDPKEEWRAPLIALGMSEDLEPEVFEYRMRPGDWLFLQTDGVDTWLRNRVNETKLKEFNKSRIFQDIQAAFDQGQGEDNFSGLLAIF